MPLLTVIIPTLNAEAQLNDCLKSLQPLSDAEVILVDGGSADNTLAIAESYPFVQVIYFTDKPGVYPAMNKGIDHAQGDWLLFMGADDHLASAESVQHAMSKVHPEAKIILGRVKNEGSEHRLVKEWYEPKWDHDLYTRNIVHHQGAIYRKDVFEHYRYPEEFKVFGDYHLNLSMYLNNDMAEIVREHFATASAAGISKQFTAGLYKEEWRMKRSLLPWKLRWWQGPVIFAKYIRKKLFK
ncbi:MAG: glycosyltransferase [Flavobacteriales bacterium]|nr:glycosyltransferase [Flavobacteriales bacterium]